MSFLFSEETLVLCGEFYGEYLCLNIDFDFKNYLKNIKYRQSSNIYITTNLQNFVILIIIFNIHIIYGIYQISLLISNKIIMAISFNRYSKCLRICFHIRTFLISFSTFVFTKTHPLADFISVNWYKSKIYF